MATPESYRQRGQEALAQKKDPAPQESPEAKTAAAYNRYRRLGHEALGEQEKSKEERERVAAQGATGTKWEVVSTAGAAIGGGFWTLGQVLKYSLLGWTLDASGVPRKDAAALKAFEDAYKATKDGSVLGGLMEGLAA